MALRSLRRWRNFAKKERLVSRDFYNTQTLRQMLRMGEYNDQLLTRKGDASRVLLLDFTYELSCPDWEQNRSVLIQETKAAFIKRSAAHRDVIIPVYYERIESYWQWLKNHSPPDTLLPPLSEFGKFRTPQAVVTYIRQGT